MLEETSAQATLNKLGSRQIPVSGNFDDELDQICTMEKAECGQVRKRQRTTTKQIQTYSHQLHSLPSETVDDLPIILPDGQRKFIYFQPKDEQLNNLNYKKLAKSITRNELDENERLEQVKEWMSEIAASELESELNEDTGENSSPALQNAGTHTKSVLLTSKYSKAEFAELVSGERTNRQVLKWVKAWDQYVFGKARNSSKFFRFDSKTKQNQQFPQDPDDPRPTQRILLLTGPPGVGKTTLAATVARHAGYRPVIVNASDERSASAVKERVFSAMQMGPVYGDARPTLLILDEIEGAANMGEGKGAISLLVNMASEGLNGSKSGKKGLCPITRPIVAICNNVFAPVLRPLRRCTQTVYFAPATSQRLTQRLKEICQNEGIAARHGALELLCEQMDNDIRSCLHGIQYLITKTNTLTPSLVATAGISNKDKSSDLWNAWIRTFTTGNVNHMSRRMRAALLSTGSTVAQSEDGFKVLHSELDKFFSDFDKFLEGVHENLLGVKYSDAMLVRTSKALDWIGRADIISKYATQNQCWEMNNYLPVSAVAIHKMCCVPNKPHITFPSLHSTLKQRSYESTSISQELSEKLSVSSGSLVKEAQVVLDLVNPVLAIVQPSVRPLPFGVMSPVEQDAVRRVVEVMTSLGLTYRSAKLQNADGSEAFWGEQYKLNPDLPKLLTGFESVIERPNSALKASLCQTIAHQVDLAQMRIRASKQVQGDVARGAKRQGNSELRKASGNQKKMRSSIEEKTNSAHQSPYPLSTAKSPKPAKVEIPQPKQQAIVKASTALDFFGREIHVSAEQKDADSKLASKSAASKFDVRFQFNEGFSNAVKRPVQLREFLLH